MSNEVPNLLVKSKEPPATKEVVWWDARGYTHPMSNTAFKKAFCEHVFMTTDDVSIRLVRDRVYRFINNFMALELQKNFENYRKIHK